MTNTIIERAANALASELLRQEPANGGGFHVDADNLAEAAISGNFDLIALTRAVLEAVREPSAAMLVDGARTVRSAEKSTHAPAAEDVWNSMITAALGECDDQYNR